MTIYSSLSGGSGGLSNPVTLAQGGTGQTLTAPAQTATLEFFNGLAQVSTASNRYRFYNDMDWTGDFDQHSSGNGAGSNNATALDSGHPGLIQLQTGTTNAGSASIARGLGSAPGIILGGGNLYYETVINIPTLAVNGGDDYKIFIGVHDGWIFTNPPNNGFFFTYFVDTSANWIINSANGGTTTSTTTTTAVATGYTRLGIFFNGGTTTATFFIGGVSVGTINTNISTNSMNLTWTIFKTNNTTNRFIFVDYVDFFYNLTTPR